MGKSQRTKGHQFERRVAADMREIGYEEARRQLEYNEDDANGIDIQNTKPFAVQCKAMKQQPNVPKVMKEIKHSFDEIPVVVYKVDNKGIFAAFRYEDALDMMKVFKDTN